MKVSRRGFTILEVIAAMGILAVVMVLVAQAGFWSMRERQRAAEQQAALEIAANVLEAARARAWQDLDPAWAARQQLPATWKDHLPEGKLSVRVEPEKLSPRSKRVTVTVSWRPERVLPPWQAQLVGIFSTRETPDSGGTP